MEDKTIITIGSPGCGKTTEMLRLVEELLNKGAKPYEIGFFTFSRKAAEEAKTRAKAKFGFVDDDLPYFRTLHSLAYHRLGLSKEAVVQHKHRVAVGKRCGVQVSYRRTDTEEVMTYGSEEGDKCLSIINLSRVKVIPMRQAWEEFADDGVSWELVQKFNDEYNKYKDEEAIVDFNDMVVRALQEKRLPKLQYIFIDEAQDLSTVQWYMVEEMGKHAEKVFVSGDDDQAIYRWGGADVDYFINLKGEQRVLDQSYRVPHGIWMIAGSIAGKIQHRREKAWSPRDELGFVGRYQYMQDVDLSKGSWYMLARNRWHLKAMEDYCMEQGFSFTTVGENRIRDGSLKAVIAWEKLRRGEALQVSEIIPCYDLLRANRNENGWGYRFGFKTNLVRLPPEATLTMQNLREKYGLLTSKEWFIALDKLSPEERQYFIAARKRGERLSDGKPRVHISTIHGVKGGEAENVLMVTDVSARSMAEMGDDEHRVFYTGVTRAKQGLHIIEPMGLNCYEI